MSDRPLWSSDPIAMKPGPEKGKAALEEGNRSVNVLGARAHVECARQRRKDRVHDSLARFEGTHSSRAQSSEHAAEEFCRRNPAPRRSIISIERMSWRVFQGIQSRIDSHPIKDSR